MYSIHLLSFLFLLILSSASATSKVAYPVRDQYPLIARVGQPYSWSISRDTFATDGSGNVTISAFGLPPWLSFSNFTFYGTPGANDEGSMNVTLKAGDAQDAFSLCVTHFPPPKENIRLIDQFIGSNPSMSSVYPVATGSALKSDKPALRVPLRWSFSIGFQPATYQNSLDLFYYAQLANGSRLPSWLSFDSKTATFDGVARTPPLGEGEKVELVLIASDQEGYSAVRAPFDLFIQSHDLSLGKSLVLNVTAGEDFKIDIRQDSWFFEEVFVDNLPFRPDDISSLSVDTSRAAWLSYDSKSLTLSGTAPSIGFFSVPMTLSAFNESLSLNTTIVLVPSYFTAATLPGSFANPGTEVSLPLDPYLTTTQFSGHDLSLSANSSVPFLNLTRETDGKYYLTGHVPSTPGVSHIDVQLSAYDHSTHAASHATLRVSFRMPSSDATARDALKRHRRLVLGLSIGLGGAAGLMLLIGSLALVRKYCRVADTAMGPYSPDEKVIESPVPDLEGGGYGWSEKAGLGLSDMPLQARRLTYTGVGIGYTPPPVPASPRAKRITKAAFFKNVKAAVRNFSAGNGSASARKRAISKPVLMFTKESAGNLRALRVAAGLDGTGYADSAPDSLEVPPGDGISLGLSSGLGSSPTSTTGHTNESGKVSIPRQRADFGPARIGHHHGTRSVSHTQAATPHKRAHSRHRSTDTQGSRSSGERDHDAELAEAVIVTASRATSLRSARSSGNSYAPTAYTRDSVHGGVQAARPRLVPFTNGKGVPVPVPTLNAISSPVGPREQRRVSQVAALISPGVGAYSKPGTQDAEADTIMTEGLRYVRAFGDHNTDLNPTRPPNLGQQSPAPLPSRSNSKRSSRSMPRIQDGLSPTQTQSSYVYPSPSQSVESSVRPGGDGGSRDSRGSRGSLMMSRILVRTGEDFSFKYPIALSAPSAPSAPTERKLFARPLYGGTSLPSFLAHSVSTATPSLTTSGSGRKRRVRYEVEFWGTPNAKDIGEVIVGIFTEGETAECVGRLVVEVVPRGA